MSENYIRNVIEAALLAAGRPLPVAEMAQLFEESVRPDDAVLRAAIEALAAGYEGRGIELKETASGIRIQVRQALAPEVSRLWPERPQRYSRALLETLALIAYRQPITRAEIESVRGVTVNPNILKTLMERNWIRVVGHREVPGRPELLGTAREFLDYFGLRRLDELPPLAELKAMGELNLQLPLPGTAESHVGQSRGDDTRADEARADDGAGDEVALVSYGVQRSESRDDGVEDGAEDDELGVRIGAAANDDELAQADGDSDGDGDNDEREAAGRDISAGLVAAPPSRDD